MEQTDSYKREGERQGLIETRGRDQLKNIYEGPMNMGNGEGTDYGSWGWAGWREAKGGKVGQL